MEKKVKIQVPQPDGGFEEKVAIELEIVENSDKWSSSKLSDGATLRYQHPILKAFKLVDEYDAEGNPIYMVNHASLLSVSVPDEIKQKK
ncbi:MAG: hypothetical protein WCS59_07165 [Sphaerochaetaceae bacterium]|nr:hypothetical protein [Sphaerochaetaceae bacterium]MDY0371759.1 hypothetical protein [Sphaerochaetaceae bacterium]